MTGYHFIIIAICPLLLLSCQEENSAPFIPPSPGSTSTECEQLENGWSISLNTVADGGVGKDGIPSIDNPRFISANDVDYLTDNELVIALKVGNEIKVYPERIMGLHEVVNDVIGGKAIAMTFCPLTGTAIAFERSIENNTTTLGVSGLLYNSNLILYDRSTDTRWSQMTYQAIYGELICESLDLVPSVVLSWGTLRKLYPEAKVLSTNTGFDRSYVDPPLSSLISTNSTPVFPYHPMDRSLPNYKRVHVIIGPTRASVYEKSDQREAFFDGDHVIVSDPNGNFFVSFFKDDTKSLELSHADDSILKDLDGNHYNIFGEVISGPNLGSKLRPTNSYVGYWFAVAAMHPDFDIFSTEQD